jgi:hypothetical protein
MADVVLGDNQAGSNLAHLTKDSNIFRNGLGVPKKARLCPAVV